MGDLIALLGKHQLHQSLVLIGCSMGGSLAMDFALEHPSPVSPLVLVGSGPSGLSLDVPSHPKQEDAERAYNDRDLDLVAELEAQIWFDGMDKQLPDTDTPAVERLGELDIPVLVVVGEHDKPFSQAAADYMVDNIPSIRKVITEDAAHLANLDHPDRLQKAVRSFLDEISC
ncbi:MAG: alpha/beta hydrolase [Candidatus Thiodiazotropha sp.]